MKRSLLIFAALCAASWTSVQAAQPIVDPEFAANVVDRYANHIYYGSGATGMALVSIAHRPAVLRHHTQVLQLKGDGAWQLVAAADFSFDE